MEKVVSMLQYLIFRTMNIETGEIKEWTVTVGLGYVDVESEEEWIQRSRDVVIKKLRQLGLDEEFLLEVGIWMNIMKRP